MFNEKEHSHTRLNILTGDRVLVSPHRMTRPWQGKLEVLPADDKPSFDPSCYLCPGNKRSDGTINPAYTGVHVFTNDYSALLPDTPPGTVNKKGLLQAQSESGSCRVICFSPDHQLTLPRMNLAAIEEVITCWQKEFATLAVMPGIKYIQIFENKGEIMGCSNPHPHGQVWASSSIPQELVKETTQQENYFEKNRRSLLADYLQLELQQKERIVLQEEHFTALVPFWATWPYETMIVCNRPMQHIGELSHAEKKSFAVLLKKLTAKYDNLFSVSFPYSAGIHQCPVNDGPHPEWHWHMHFYPPLLRNATVKKFMVGYEMLANPQRDITPEVAAAALRAVPEIHYKEIKPPTNEH